jgi:catechol 2,3-dioxygenase
MSQADGPEFVERSRDIAHVGSVELFSPLPQETVAFFRDLMSMKVVHSADDSTYLHAWDDYERWTIKVTARAQAGVGRTYLRAASPAALERRVAAMQDHGVSGRWVQDEWALGRIWLGTDPDGHELGLYFDTEWYSPGDDDRPSLKNQASRLPLGGTRVRRLDHVNYLAADIPGVCTFLEAAMGGRMTERIVMDDGTTAAAWYTFSDKSYDLVYTGDWVAGASGRLHHVAFATDTREDILRAADLFLDSGVHIETGPHKHAIQQTFFLYVWEPGGNRIELCNAAARLVLAPDWAPVTWTQQERAKGQAWGLKTIGTFHTHGTPVI